MFALLKFAFFLYFSRFFGVFFRGGSNMVAFRAKVDGKWQANFQRRLRYRLTGLRPSGLPNLPFSLVLSPPPLSSTSLPVSHSFPNFSSFHLFPSSLPFFPFFPQFTSNFSSLPSSSRFFQRFLVKATRLHVTLCQQCAPRGTGYRSERDMLRKCILHNSQHFWEHSKKEGPIW